MAISDIEKRLKKFRKSSAKRTVSAWIPKILWGMIFVGLAVIIAGVAFITYYLNQPKGVDLEVTAPTDVSRGVPFELDLNITNVSGNPITNSSIAVTLSNGLLIWNSTTSGSVYSENTGDVGVGDLVKKSYQVIPVGDLNSSQTLDVSFFYFNQTGSRFEVKQEVKVLLSNSAVAMSVTKPDQILNGSALSFDVNYANSSDFNFPAMILEADFPSSFQFKSASAPAATLANTFALGSAAANATGTVTIKGVFTDSSASSFTIPLKLYAVLNGQNYDIADYQATFSLSPSPIGVSVTVNGSDNYVAKPVDTLNYSIQYNNQSGIALKDVVVKAILSGFADWSSVKTDGIFNPSTRTVTWNSSTTPALAFVEPSTVGSLNLTLSTTLSAPVSLQGLSNKNLYVKADVVLSSPSVPYYVSGNQTFAETTEETKISSLVYFSAKGYTNDPSSAVQNSGPFPPHVGSATEYSIHWKISDFGNDLSNAVVSAPLPTGVTWTGFATTTVASSSISYDTSTESMVWNIGNIFAGSGFLGGPAEAVFQVSATPSSDFIGSYEGLLGASNLQATDNFTGATVNISAGPVTTALPDDSSVAPGSGVVTQ